MRHRKGIKKLSKATPERMAMLRSLTQSLFKHGKIKTTLHRGRAVKRVAETLITAAKRGDLSSRRKVFSKVHDKGAVKNIFQIARERFEGRSGGYTRITRLRRRRGDAAEIVLLELL